MPLNPKLRISLDQAERIRNLHPDIRKTVRKALDQILSNPNVGKALRDDLTGLRSYRIGPYRVIYRIDAEAIAIVNIGPRSSIYDETLRLIHESEASK